MTICIGVKVNDGVVFVADSASSIVVQGADGQQGIQRVYNHGDKVFNLYRGLPVAAMTCGLGAFGSESISTIAKGIRKEMMDAGSGIEPNSYSVKAITTFAYDRFLKKFEGLDDGTRAVASFEFFVGGYSHDDGGSEIWKFQFAKGNATEPTLIADRGVCNIIWAGQPEACTRLVLGHASVTYDVLRRANLTHEQALNLVDSIRREAEAPLLAPAMPVIDAIDLAEFLAGTSAKFVKFLPGADTVGGSLDVATVTKFEGFRWVRRKHFYPPELNRETDHVS